MVDKKIRIAICGYGNLGKGVEKALINSSDMELKCIFTRRMPELLNPTSDVPVIKIESVMKDIKYWQEQIDIVLLCGGSAKDLPVQGPKFAKYFNTVDSFDTHADIPQYYENMDISAKSGNHTSLISVRMGPRTFFD